MNFVQMWKRSLMKQTLSLVFSSSFSFKISLSSFNPALNSIILSSNLVWMDSRSRFLNYPVDKR